MIAKITRGWRPGGLLRYLMGPGRHNEHVNPRVLDTWDGIPAVQPVQIGPGEFDLRDLEAGLTDPAVAAGIRFAEPAPGANGKVPRGPVWQCSLRTEKGDRVLSDDQWREIVRDLLHRTGIAPRGEGGGCRWVMVRHADDHVHVAAVLVREDTGKKYFPRNDYLRARETCLAAEQKYGLGRTAPVDRTALPAVTRAETEKAARRDLEPSRVWLRRAVRVAAVGAQDEEAFFECLREAGVLIRRRHDADGKLVGYAVAQPGDAACGGEPVWYAGCALARDLSLPQLTRRWASAPGPGPVIPPESGERATVGSAQRSAALTEATAAARQAAESLAAGEDDNGGIAHATGDLLTALAQVTPESAEGTREQWARVAEEYDRAARTPGVGQPRVWGAHAQALRTAAWQLATVRVLSGRGSDTAGAVMLAGALAILVAEIAAYHAARARHIQAAAARGAHAELVASRAGRAEGAARPVTSRVATGEGEVAADILAHQSSAVTRVAPGPQRPVPGETRQVGRSR